MYRTVETSFWNDPKIRQLSPNEKLLFIYLITNPHAHVSGIYYLPSVLMSHETGLTDVDTLWDTLSIGNLALRDTTSEVIWVVNMLRYQGSGEKVYRGVLKHLKTLHASPITQQYLNHYKELFDPIISKNPDLVITPQYPMDRVSYARAGEQEQEQEQEIPPTPLTIVSGNSKTKAKLKISPEAELVLDHLNQTTGHNYRDPSQIQTLFNQTDATLEECCLVIDWLHLWRRKHDPDWVAQYFDNTTPFRPSNFDKFRAKAEAWDGNGRVDGGADSSLIEWAKQQDAANTERKVVL